MTIWRKLTDAAQASSYPISIFMAGDIEIAKRVCREYCDEVGFCVTLTATDYIYRGGSEGGFVVGLINYPRFPLEPETLFIRAEEIADRLIEACGQESASIQGPAWTYWESYRPKD